MARRRLLRDTMTLRAPTPMSAALADELSAQQVAPICHGARAGASATRAENNAHTAGVW